jgi:hypothetical protein
MESVGSLGPAGIEDVTTVDHTTWDQHGSMLAHPAGDAQSWPPPETAFKARDGFALR